MKKFNSILTLISLIILMTSCSLFSPRTDLEFLSSKLNGLDISSGTIEYYNDTHGGFHGDGHAYAEIKFPDNTVSERIKQSDHWSATPLTYNLSVVIYGGSFINDKKIPQITNGYYYFEDRHRDSTDTKDDTEIFNRNRYSYNFTIAIYDLDTNILYFYAIDT